jgi:hypothetical protein
LRAGFENRFCPAHTLAISEFPGRPCALEGCGDCHDAKKALAACIETDEVKKLRDLAMAQRCYAQQAMDKTMLRDAAAIVRRAEFRLAELVEAQRQTIGHTWDTAWRVPRQLAERTTLADALIDKEPAKRVRQAHAIAAPRAGHRRKGDRAGSRGRSPRSPLTSR